VVGLIEACEWLKILRNKYSNLTMRTPVIVSDVAAKLSLMRIDPFAITVIKTGKKKQKNIEFFHRSIVITVEWNGRHLSINHFVFPVAENWPPKKIVFFIDS
jgi:hypothetical protein